MYRLLAILLVFSLSQNPLSAQVLFPGDTNNDGICNYLDLLPVGLSYGLSGPQRFILTIDWSPQDFLFWDDLIPGSNLDLAFADADGNGTIDSLDLDAFALNYDSIQNNSAPPPGNYIATDTLQIDSFPGGVGIEVVYNQDTFMVGDTLRANINFVYPASMNPDSGFVGVAFVLEYDTSVVLDSSIRLFPDTLSGDLLYTYATSQGPDIWRGISPGRIELAASGFGAIAFNQNRLIANFEIIIVDDIIRQDTFLPFTLNILDPILARPTGQAYIPFDTVHPLVLFQVLNNVQEVMPLGWSCSPNPVHSTIQIEAHGHQLQQAKLLSAKGTLIGSFNLNHTSSDSINLDQLPPGTYLLQVESQKSVSAKWIIKI